MHKNKINKKIEDDFCHKAKKLKDAKEVVYSQSSLNSLISEMKNSDLNEKDAKLSLIENYMQMKNALDVMQLAEEVIEEKTEILMHEERIKIESNVEELI